MQTPGARDLKNIFDVPQGPNRGPTAGHQILQPGKSAELLKDWDVSCEPFSTVLIFHVVQTTPPVITDDASDAFARINFGSGTGLLQGDCPFVDVDLENGTAVGVIGNCGLSVQLIYGPLVAGWSDPQATQPTLMVDLSVAHGVYPHDARRTVKFGTINANTTFAPAQPIPLQAREAYLVNLNAANVPALELTQFLQLNGVAISDDFVTKKEDGTVIVADGARFFTLTTGNFASNKTSVVWTLNL